MPLPAVDMMDMRVHAARSLYVSSIFSCKACTFQRLAETIRGGGQRGDVANMYCTNAAEEALQVCRCTRELRKTTNSHREVSPGFEAISTGLTCQMRYMPRDCRHVRNIHTSLFGQANQHNPGASDEFWMDPATQVLPHVGCPINARKESGDKQQISGQEEGVFPGEKSDGLWKEWGRV